MSCRTFRVVGVDSATILFVCQGGETVEGQVRLRASPVGDTLVLYLPPGGFEVGACGLGARRWWAIPLTERGVLMAEFVQRMRDQLSRTVAGESPGDVDFARLYPGLWEFLSLAKLPDGSPRSRSKMQLFLDGPCWKASLTEPDAECSAFVTAETYLDLLQSLENAIQADSLDWRRWWVGGKAGKGSKRS